MKSVYPNHILYELQKLVADMSRIDRNHFQPGEDRRENDIEHSFAVAMLCWYVIDSQKLNQDELDVFVKLMRRFAHALEDGPKTGA